MKNGGVAKQSSALIKNGTINGAQPLKKEEMNG